MAGRVQIEALGQLSDSLTVDPSFSFFTKRYSKYTHYATETCKISFPKGVYTDDFLDVTIPQNCGDILQEVALSFTVDPTDVASLGSNLSPIDIFGISVIDYVELYVGDQKIDTVTSDDIFINRELNISESYRSSLDVLHGKHFQGSSDREFLQEFYDGQFSTQGIDPFDGSEYRVQIPFYFHRRPGHGFPLCAIKKQELSLRIKLRPTNDVIFASQEIFGGNLWDPRANNQITEPLKLGDFKINLTVVHLNMPERCMLQNKPLDILFEQRQRNTFQIEPESKVGNFRLDFKNCVKELFFIAKKTGKWSDEYLSILDQLRELDNYTSAQQTTLLILKLIPVWSGAIGNVLDTLYREDDNNVRTELINAVRNLFYWGTDDTYTSVLEELKTYSENISTEETRVGIIKTYLNSIPGTVLGIQLEANALLDSLINEADEDTRSDIIDDLLEYKNVWGTEQENTLESLRNPGNPIEGLLIFGLRVYLTTASYYLKGLSELKPGTTEQVATVNKVTEIFDNTKAEYDILKFGIKAVLDNIPGKTAYERSRIIYAIIKTSKYEIGSTRSIWSDTQLEDLEGLKTDPGSNVNLIATQRATIDALIGFLNSLDDVKSFINAELTLLDGESNYDTRDDIVNNLTNLLNLATPGPFWGETQLGLLEQLRNSGLALAGTPTEDTYISNLRTYANSQIVSDSATVKSLVDGQLTLLNDQTDELTRVGIVNILLGLNANPENLFWTQTEVNLLNLLKTPGLPDEDDYILTLRTYTDKIVYGLRLITEGIVGSTGIEYTIDRLLTLLPSATSETTPTRSNIVDGLLAIPGIWRQTEVNLLNLLRTPSLPDENTYILALRVQSNTLTFNVAAGVIPGDFPEGTNAERDALVEILRRIPLWEDTIIKLVNEFWNWTVDVYGYLIGLKTEGIAGTQSETTLIAAVRAYTSNTQVDTLLTSLAGVTDQQTRVSIVDQIIAVPSQVLSGYLKGVLASASVFKLRLNVLKAGINGVLNSLPETAAERDPIILGISTLHTWSDTQFFFLNALRTPSIYDFIYINALKISTGSLDLYTLPSDENVRNGIVNGLSAIQNFWSTEQKTLIDALADPDNDATTIPALNALVTNVPIMTGYTQFDQNNVIDGIIGQTIWGEKYFDLNDLRQIEPGFVGQGTVITELGAYLGDLPSSLGYIVDGVDATLDNVTIISIGDERTNILSNIASISNIWTENELNSLNYMKEHVDQDATRIAELKNYINTVIGNYDTAVSYLDYYYTITNNNDLTTLVNYPFWSAAQLDEDTGEVTQLKALVTDRLNTGGQVTDSEQYFKYVLSLYVKELRFYWNIVKQGIAATVNSIVPTVTNSVERGKLIGLLTDEDNPLLDWGTDQLALLNELSTVDSKNHANAVVAIVNYLDTVLAAIYNPSGGPSGLLVDIETPGITSADLQNDDLQKAIWGGYFYYLLEALENPAITTDEEAGIIGKLSTHILISQSSESRTKNLNFLINQLTTTYPETIFNKWVRAKKNVPLMYSKQKYTTLECDGLKILDETTGSNMFLSASIPNLYHKRSPNFRNINMYSFALYPNDLHPSGHLNFSTVKDAKVYMELQYDGAHGTFDFDDNYISLFGIDRIYFPKQVIIIAKSYNMMIIRNGEARIIF